MAIILMLIILSIVFVTFQRTFPVADDKWLNLLDSRDKLIKKHRKRLAFAVLLLFPGVILFGFIWFNVLTYLAELRWLSLEGNTFYKDASSAVYLVPTILLAVATSVYAVFKSYQFLMKKKFQDFLAAYNLQYQFNAMSMLRGVILLMVIGSMIATVAILKHYIVFSEENIVVNRFSQIFSENKAYSDIQHIYHATHAKAPNGNLVERSNYIIEFSDGSSWKTDDSMFKSRTSDVKLIQFVEMKSGKQIKEIQLYEKE